MPPSSTSPPPPEDAAAGRAAVLVAALWLVTLARSFYADWRCVLGFAVLVCYGTWLAAEHQSKDWWEFFFAQRSQLSRRSSGRVSVAKLDALARTATIQERGPPPASTALRLVGFCWVCGSLVLGALWGSVVFCWVRYPGYLPAYALPTFTSRVTVEDTLLRVESTVSGRGVMKDLEYAARINLLATRMWCQDGLDGVQVALEALRAASVTQVMELAGQNPVVTALRQDAIGLLLGVQVHGLGAVMTDNGLTTGYWGLGMAWEKRSALGTERSRLVRYNASSGRESEAACPALLSDAEVEGDQDDEGSSNGVGLGAHECLGCGLCESLNSDESSDRLDDSISDDGLDYVDARRDRGSSKARRRASSEGRSQGNPQTVYRDGAKGGLASGKPGRSSEPSESRSDRLQAAKKGASPSGSASGKPGRSSEPSGHRSDSASGPKGKSAAGRSRDPSNARAGLSGDRGRVKETSAPGLSSRRPDHGGQGAREHPNPGVAAGRQSPEGKQNVSLPVGGQTGKPAASSITQSVSQSGSPSFFRVLCIAGLTASVMLIALLWLDHAWATLRAAVVSRVSRVLRRSDGRAASLAVDSTELAEDAPTEAEAGEQPASEAPQQPRQDEKVGALPIPTSPQQAPQVQLREQQPQQRPDGPEAPPSPSSPPSPSVPMPAGAAATAKPKRAAPAAKKPAAATSAPSEKQERRQGLQTAAPPNVAAVDTLTAAAPAAAAAPPAPAQPTAALKPAASARAPGGRKKPRTTTAASRGPHVADATVYMTDAEAPHGAGQLSTDAADKLLAAAAAAVHAAMPFTGSLARKSKGKTDTAADPFPEAAAAIDIPPVASAPTAAERPLSVAGAAKPAVSLAAAALAQPAVASLPYAPTAFSSAAAFRSFVMPSAAAPPSTQPARNAAVRSVKPALGTALPCFYAAAQPRRGPHGAIVAPRSTPITPAPTPTVAEVAPPDDEIPVPIPVPITKPLPVQQLQVSPAVPLTAKQATVGLNPALALFLDRAGSAAAKPAAGPAASAVAHPSNTQGGPATFVRSGKLADGTCFQCRKEPASVIFVHGSLCHVCYCYDCGASARDGDACPECGEEALRVLRVKKG